eukprot:GHVU01175854.1.p3 GENE.GHVU01175854.1~~GHVU01175854.1.p3  ORF type:complete len:130 (-),score=24.69 GHVU01175854.1:249-638(-)
MFVLEGRAHALSSPPPPRPLSSLSAPALSAELTARSALKTRADMDVGTASTWETTTTCGSCSSCTVRPPPADADDDDDEDSEEDEEAKESVALALEGSSALKWLNCVFNVCRSSNGDRLAALHARTYKR